MKKIIDWLSKNRKPISFAKMLIFALCLVASLRWYTLINVSLVLAIIFALTEFDFDGFYFCFFLINFRFIFRNGFTGNIPYVSVVLGVFAVFAFIKYYLVKKEKLKLNWWIVGFSIAFLAYLLLPIHTFIFGEYMKFVIMIFSINFIYLFKDKIEFKKLILAFVYGCIIGSLIFLITQVLFSSYFYKMTWHVTAYEKTRFRGCAGDPNYYSVDILLSFAGLFLLYFQNKINNYHYFALILILAPFAWITYSKSLIIGLSVLVLGMLIVAIFNSFKINWHRPLTFILVILVGFLATNFVFKMNTINLLRRFVGGSDITISEDFVASDKEDKSEDSTSESEDSEDKENQDTTKDEDDTAKDDKLEENGKKDPLVYDVPGGEDKQSEQLDYLLTGRWTLWKNHLKFVFDSPKNFIIGGGIGTFVKPMECHNTYIQIIYETGIIGTILFAAIMISVLWGMGFNKKLFKTNKLINWLSIVVSGIMFLNVNYFGSTSFVYHISLCLFALFHNDKIVNKRNEEMKDGKENIDNSTGIQG